MKIERSIKKDLIDKITAKRHKVVMLYGPRQVGKTTLVQDIIKELPYKTLSIDGDEKKYHQMFTSGDIARFRELVSGYELFFIDEAQKIPEVSTAVRLIHDHIKG